MGKVGFGLFVVDWLLSQPAIWKKKITVIKIIYDTYSATENSDKQN